jgi:hypothetical protein
MLKQIWNSDRFWKIVGKVSVLIGILGGLIVVLSWLFAPENRPKLLTFVATAKFEYPVGLEVALRDIRELNSRRAIFSTLSGEMSARLKLTEPQADEISGELAEYFYKAWAKDLRNGLPQYNGYARFLIVNYSAIEADNVVIDLPFARGIARVVSEGSAIKTSGFAEAIEIGLIRPRKFVGVDIWLDKEIQNYHEEQIQVTHRAGLSQIAFRRATYSLLGAYKEHLGSFWFPAAEGLLVALLLVLLGSF